MSVLPQLRWLVPDICPKTLDFDARQTHVKIINESLSTYFESTINTQELRVKMIFN